MGSLVGIFGAPYVDLEPLLLQVARRGAVQVVRRGPDPAEGLADGAGEASAPGRAGSFAPGRAGSLARGGTEILTRGVAEGFPRGLGEGARRGAEGDRAVLQGVDLADGGQWRTGPDPLDVFFQEIDDEIMRGLVEIEAPDSPGAGLGGASYTGGSLKWMGVCAPSTERDGYVDYGHLIARFSRDEFVRFVSLADDPDVFDPELQHQYAFGDETEHPLNKRQMLYLKYRYGVYFPWKLAYHLVTNVDWEDKNSGAGKTFSPEAERVFPKTVSFIKSLPFREIGRCLIFGLEANDHAPLHRDTEPGTKDDIDHCLSICPRGDKRLYLCDPEERVRLLVRSRAYWFNDMDYHGVLPDPYFRYSIRIDGVFEPWFLEAARRLA